MKKIEKVSNMRCVLCDADAEYIFDGISFCKRHLLKEKWNKDFSISNMRRREISNELL